jgi:molecular chaperone DnaK
VAAATIDFSIDLGVTNSRIAVARDGAAHVVLNGEGLESTPTAVWCDERERLIVGSQTRDRLLDDAGNVADRFRSQLGTDEVFRFARQHRPAEPDDLAAEVIGSLRADARRRTGRDVQAAVLTAPTGFAAAQRDALVAAARKAGVAVSPLLQEPVAAGLP